MKSTRERIQEYIDTLDPAGLGVVPEGLTYTLTMEQLVGLVSMAPRSTEENEMSEREQFEAWLIATYPEPYTLQKGFAKALQEAWCAAKEQQAKELADLEATCLYITREKLDVLTKLEAAQARVGELFLVLKQIRNDIRLPLELRTQTNKALASADTAAQTLREKHYEECAVICETQAFTGLGSSRNAEAIRAAAKEKP